MHEESIKKSGSLKLAERGRLLEAAVLGSGKEAAAKGQSLALIRPSNVKFRHKAKKKELIQAERESYNRAARQVSMFDKALAKIEPSPFHFRFTFEDAAGKHDYDCGDWETHAMFWRLRGQKGEAGALSKMSEVYNDESPSRGIVFAIGNQAKRPHVWQLLGVIRLDPPNQEELF